MNPWGAIVILLGIVLIVVGWKGAYRNAWEFLTGNVLQQRSSTPTASNGQMPTATPGPAPTPPL